MMNGASMALVPAYFEVGLGAWFRSAGLYRRAMVRGFSPLAMCIVVSRRTIWMPSQKEPQVIQGWSFPSMTKLGSMAFHWSRFSREATMHPSSFQMGRASERVLSSPMAEPFLPNVEQL